MESESYWILLLFIAAVMVVATSGMYFRPDDWYQRLAKPSWQPPGWLFGPVWMILYAVIAVSGWLIWSEVGWAGAAIPLAIYGAQLILNWLWSAIFFGLKRIGLALAEMALLWLSIVAMIVTFYPIHSGAALLLLPYLAWVSFAMLLNYTIWRLNGEAHVALP